MSGCPGIAALVACAIPHKLLGETVGVVVVLETGWHVSFTDILAFGSKTQLLSQQWLPQCVVYMRDIPKGPSGKVERIKLPKLLGIPTLEATDMLVAFEYNEGSLVRIDKMLHESYEPPSTELHKSVLSIFTRVLLDQVQHSTSAQEVDRIGIKSDFYQHGGNSILATMLFSRLRSSLGSQLRK